MATVEDLPAAVAAAPPPPGAAAAAPPVVLIVDQRINSSSGKLVQLSRQDSQYTDKEKGRTSNPAYDSTVLGSRRHLDFILDPTSQITSNLRVVDDMPETDDAESQESSMHWSTTIVSAAHGFEKHRGGCPTAAG